MRKDDIEREAQTNRGRGNKGTDVTERKRGDKERETG